MQVQRLHSWDLTPKEAVTLQKELAAQVEAGPPLFHCELVAGADVSYNRFSSIFFAGVVVLRTSDWTVIEQQGAAREVHFPYIPGLLSFRETPALLDAFAKVQSEPDAVIVDAHGYSHPRRFGLTCHVGLCLDRPTLGCAKTVLVGKYQEPDGKAGAHTPLMDKGEVIGEALRTRDHVQPVFVSVGHRIDLPSAVRTVLQACRGYRLPEPTRQAHNYVNALRRQGHI